MNALEPGLYKATVRGVVDQIVMLQGVPGAPFESMDEVRGFLTHRAENVTDARPLIVLDLPNPQRFAELLRNLDSAGNTWFTRAAEQVEAQTKPARIPEPGWGEKVTAHTKEDPERRPFVHWHGASVNKNAWADNNTTCHWGRLIDPQLVVTS